MSDTTKPKTLADLTSDLARTGEENVKRTVEKLFGKSDDTPKAWRKALTRYREQNRKKESPNEKH